MVFDKIKKTLGTLVLASAIGLSGCNKLEPANKTEPEIYHLSGKPLSVELTGNYIDEDGKFQSGTLACVFEEEDGTHNSFTTKNSWLEQLTEMAAIIQAEIVDGDTEKIYIDCKDNRYFCGDNEVVDFNIKYNGYDYGFVSPKNLDGSY